MEILIFLVWGFSLLLTPFIFLVTAYYSYFHEGKIGEVILRTILSFIGYIAVTMASAPFFFVLIFAGAHSKNGISFDYTGIIFYWAITFIYTAVCYLLISLVKGGLINPWKLFAWENNKEISILGSERI